MGDAAEQHFSDAPWRFGQHGRKSQSLGDPHVPATLLYGLDDFVGHLLAGDVNHELQPVEAPERRRCRLEVIGLGEHLGRDRPELNEGGADRQPAQIGPQPRGEVGERGLGRRIADKAGEDATAGQRGDVDKCDRRRVLASGG